MTVIHQIETLLASNTMDIQRPNACWPVTMHSPAMEVFTDFVRQHPMLLEQGTTISSARETMKNTHTSLFLVIDGREKFRGVVTLENLLSERLLRESGHSRMRSDEMTVEHVMTPKSHLRAIRFTSLQLANVGDVLATLKEYGQQHLMVVLGEPGSIRGIVSTHTIARRMHESGTIKERAVTFSEIYQALAC